MKCRINPFFPAGIICAVVLSPWRLFAQQREDEGDPLPLDTNNVYETVVMDRRPAPTAGTTILDADTIEKRHPASGDEMLDLVPGIKIVQHGAEGKGHQIFMRGFDAAHGSDVQGVLVGVPLNEPSQVHGQGYLDLYGIIPEVVSDMTVSNGPFLPWQGDFAIAGSVRLELAIPAKRRPGFFVTEGTHRGKVRQVAVLAPEGADDATLAATEIVYNAGFGPDRESQRAALIAQYRTALGKQGALTTLLMLQSARFESPETLRWSDVKEGKKEFWDSYGPPGAGRSDRLMLKTGYAFERSAHEIRLSLYGMLRDFRLDENFTGRLLYPSHGDLRSQTQQGETLGVDVETESRINVRFPTRLLGGIGWRMDRFKQQERQLDAAGTPWQVNRHLRALQQSLYAYLGAQLSPVTTLSLFPSLRLASFIFHVDDRQNGKGTDHFETLIPRIAARFDPHQRVALFASWGRGYRSPEARAVTAQPVEEIEDERLSRYVGGRAEVAVVDGFEAGIETSPIDILTLSLVGFASLLDTEMVFDHVSNLNVAMDGTRRFGATLRGAVAPFEWLSLAGDVTFTDARFNHSKNRVPGVPIWMGTARADIGRRRGPKGGLSALVVGRRPLQHNASVNGYVDLGITAGWRFERVDVTAMIENVANQKIMEGAYHFASWFDETEARSALPSIHYAAGEPLTVRLLATVYL